jgi:hypothetical protein
MTTACTVSDALGFGFLIGAGVVGSLWFFTELARRWTRHVPKDGDDE